MLRILLLIAFASVLLLASCVKDIEGDEEFTGAVKASGSPVVTDTEAQPIDADTEEAVDEEVADEDGESAEEVEGVDGEEEAEAEDMDDEDVGEDADEDEDEDEADDETEEATE